MSWWKKASSLYGQIMTINRLNGVNYKLINRFFGEPHNIEKFKTGVVYRAEWKLLIFNIPYTIRLDASIAAHEEYREKQGLGKYQVPSVEDKIVNFAEVMGKRYLFEKIVGPLLKMVLIDGYKRKTAINTIAYVFERI